MHQALLFIAATIASAHDRWRLGAARRRTLSGKIAALEGRVARLEAESDLLRFRFLRVPGTRRPHYRTHARMDILWHAARYGLSVEETARVFVLSVQTILSWRRLMQRKDPNLLPPLHGLSDLVHELVHRLKVEWPRWGTRRIAGQLARMGVKASRSSVQRILRRGPRTPTEPEVTSASTGRVLRAKHLDHIWMIDFTKVGGLVQRLLTGHGVLRRYGAVGPRGSIALIERTWRTLKNEYVRRLFLHRPNRTLETHLRRWARWHNSWRPHQGLGQCAT